MIGNKLTSSVVLYFLRSSEKKIVQNMTPLAHKHSKNLNVYYDFYGLTSNDLGLYALVDNVIVGAIWSRKIEGNPPLLSVAVLPEQRRKGLGSAMLEQFLLEAASLYEELNVETYADESSINFYTKFGFVLREGTMMQKLLKRKEVIRPSDGYDPRRWMD